MYCHSLYPLIINDMNKEIHEGEKILLGTILRVPLIIEDKATSETIKNSSLWLHVSGADYEPSNNPLFINKSLTAICSEGYFHKTLTTDNSNRVFRRYIPNIDLSNDKHFELLNNLFPLDLESLIEAKQTTKDPTQQQQQLKLMAKLISDKSNYDANNEYLDDIEPNKNNIVLSIKTDAKYAVTIGTIELPPVDIENNPYLNDEENLLNWMELYNSQNESLLELLIESNNNLDRLKSENQKLELNLELTKNDYDKIIEDLELKFYLVLNSKKDKIYELTHK